MSALAMIQKVQRLQKMQATLRGAPKPTRSLRLTDLGTLGFVACLSPELAEPYWLADVAEAFDRTETERQRLLLSVPPQHGKTKLILHGIVRLLLRHPSWPIVYATYSQDRANDVSLECQDLAKLAGIELRQDASSRRRWLTTKGGGIHFTGVSGGLTGAPARILIIDDPHKNRVEAESVAHRNEVHSFMSSTARTRIHPATSIVVVHTRWHEDDCIGRLMRQRLPSGGLAYRTINKPALDEVGKALWPEERPAWFLEEQRAVLTDYDWFSLYMGAPRPPGGALFRDVQYYDELPKTFRVGIGFDLAYTAKTHADYSSAVVLAESEDRKSVV